jgi:type II secretory pathway component PulC
MKKKFSQTIFIISVLALTVASLWVYLSVHRALKKTEKPVLTPQETRVLNPNLDESIFEELQKRKI